MCKTPTQPSLAGIFVLARCAALVQNTVSSLKKIYKQWVLVSNQAPIFINSGICSCYKGCLLDDNHLNLMTNRGITALTLELSALNYISLE